MQHRFTLVDRDGATHEYITDAHPATEGEAIVLQLAALAPEPLLAAIDSLKGSIGKSLDEDVSTLLEQALDQVDWSALGGPLASALSRMDGQALRRAILKHTMRDGKRLAGDAFEKAYARNYGELFRAVVEVCRFNGFFPEFGTTSTT